MNKRKHYIFSFKTVADSRGALTSIEEMQDIPIDIKRIFYMHRICSDRGGHAHIDTDQVVIAISGSFKVKLYDGKESAEYFLYDCTKGLYIPRLTFTNLYDFTSDAVCLVLANTHYDMNRSLRSLSDYISFIK